MRKRFARGDVAFMSDGPWTKYLLEELTGETFEKNFEVVLNPVHSGQNSYSWNYNHALAICSQSENELYAAKLIDALTNDDEISNYFYSRVGFLPVNKHSLDDPLYTTGFYSAFKTQLRHASCMDAQNEMFDRGMVFCVDAIHKILFQDADIEQELNESVLLFVNFACFGEG